jgi:hypothetical protein
VWRAHDPTTAFAIIGNGDATQYIQRGGANLQQEVYSWQTKEDYFGGVSDENVRAELQDGLMSKFDASISPVDRNCAELKKFLDLATNHIASGQSEWIASADAPGDDDDDLPYLLDPLQALVNHLQWIHDVYAHQPGVSVLVR